MIECCRSLEKPSTKQALLGYGALVKKEVGAGPAISRIKKDISVLKQLDNINLTLDKISPNQLLATFGKKALWKNPNMFGYLFKSGHMPRCTREDAELFSALSSQRGTIERQETNWIKHALDEYHAELLKIREFRTERGSTFSMKTISTALVAAAALLNFVNNNAVSQLSGIHVQHIESFLVEKKGYANSIRRFVNWLNSSKKVFRKLTLPAAKPSSVGSLGLSLEDQRRLYQQWIEATVEETKPAVIGIMMLLFAQKPKQVARMKLDQIVQLDDGSYTVKLAAVPVKLGPDESALLRRYLEQRRRWSIVDVIDESPWLFPGRGWKEHMGEASIGDYVRDWGTTATELFATAMYQAYADGIGNPKVTARIFGVTTFTAVKYFNFFDPRLAAGLHERSNRSK